MAQETVVVIRTGLRVMKDPSGLAWGSHDEVISSIAVGLVTGQAVDAALAHHMVYTAQHLVVKLDAYLLH